MFKLIWSGLFTLLLLSGCGWNGTPTRSPEGILPLTSIEIIPVSSKIAQGTSTKLTARGFYSGVPNGVDITDKVVWSVDNTSKAFADFKYTTAPNNNRVSGIAKGDAVVTATVGNVSASFTLHVTEATVTGMTITTVPPIVPPATPTVLNGSTKQFAAIGTFSDSSTQDLTFDASWSASGTFAAVSDDPASKGLATAIAKGDETITATFIFGTNTTKATTTLTVIELQSIAVTTANSSIAGFSKTVQFTATGTYSDGSTKDITTAVTWSSSSTGIATIIANSGVATTVAAGETTISATLGVISGSTILKVTAPVPISLLISPVNPLLSLSSGTATLQLTVTATFADIPSQNVTSSSIFTINPASSIATVSATGLVTANSTGTGLVTIEAKYLDSNPVSTTVTITQ